MAKDRPEKLTLEFIRDLPLLYHTSHEWVELVTRNFPLALADHASNERKAAATAMDFVVRYPDRLSLVSVSARIAQEEILHFRQVFERMRRLGYPLRPDEKDPYVRKILSHLRSNGDERLMDRLLVASIIELRGIERFALLANLHPEPDWRAFYDTLGLTEIGHGNLFRIEAEKIFGKDPVTKRFREFLEWEADACRNTPLSWRFH